MASMIEKDRADDGLRPVGFGGGDKYLSFDGVGEEQHDDAISTSKLEDVLQKLGGASLTEADSDELLIEAVAAVARGRPGRAGGAEDGDGRQSAGGAPRAAAPRAAAGRARQPRDAEDEVGRAAGLDDKSSAPVRTDLRQMG